MKIGYARVSSVGQSLDSQLERLAAVGCEKVYRTGIAEVAALLRGVRARPL